MANRFYVEPANPLQALMAGTSAYDSASKRTKEADMLAGRQQAMQSLQAGGEARGALAQLMGIGDVQGAQAIGSLMDRETANTRDTRDFAFRQQESQRAQTNADRGFGLQQRQIGLAENKIPAEIDSRRQAVAAQGHDPNDPQMRAFIMSGRMPREDQQPLTATDKKAIMESDEGVMSAENAISALNQAKGLSKKAYEGPAAATRGYVTSLIGSEAGETTTELNNLVQTNALGQLKAIFGGAPTEGERKILLDIQGSASQPDGVRQKIYDRAIALAERRLAFNKQRSDEMRGGSFYKPNGTPPSATGKGQDRMQRSDPGSVPGQTLPPQAPAAASIPPPPPGFRLVE